MKKFEQLKQHAIEELGLSREQIRRFGALNKRSTWEQAIAAVQNSQLHLGLSNLCPDTGLSDTRLSDLKSVSPFTDPSSVNSIDSSMTDSHQTDVNQNTDHSTFGPTVIQDSIQDSVQSVSTSPTIKPYPLTVSAKKSSRSVQTSLQVLDRKAPEIQSQVQARNIFNPLLNSKSSGVQTQSIQETDSGLDCPECTVNQFLLKFGRREILNQLTLTCQVCQGKGRVMDQTALEWTATQMENCGCSQQEIERFKILSPPSKLTYLTACVDIRQTRSLLSFSEPNSTSDFSSNSSSQAS
ncbi:MAG: hypothetical protein ACRC8A_14135 [Microcoleaceae cyanobacterium]